MAKSFSNKEILNLCLEAALFDDVEYIKKIAKDSKTKNLLSSYNWKVFREAAGAGSIKILEFLKSEFPECFSEMVAGADGNGHAYKSVIMSLCKSDNEQGYECFKWIFDHSSQKLKDNIVRAVDYTKKEPYAVLRILYEQSKFLKMKEIFLSLSEDLQEEIKGSGTELAENVTLFSEDLDDVQLIMFMGRGTSHDIEMLNNRNSDSRINFFKSSPIPSFSSL